LLRPFISHALTHSALEITHVQDEKRLQFGEISSASKLNYIDFPEDILLDRFDQLSPSQQLLLKCCSICGSCFQLGSILAMRSQLNAVSLVADLQKLIEVGLLNITRSSKLLTRPVALPSLRTFVRGFENQIKMNPIFLPTIDDADGSVVLSCLSDFPFDSVGIEHTPVDSDVFDIDGLESFELVFGTEQIRHILYQRLLYANRVTLHRLLALWIETVCRPNMCFHIDSLVSHWQVVYEFETDVTLKLNACKKLINWCQLGAQFAAKTTMFTQAQHLIEIALQLFRRIPLSLSSAFTRHDVEIVNEMVIPQNHDLCDVLSTSILLASVFGNLRKETYITTDVVVSSPKSLSTGIRVQLPKRFPHCLLDAAESSLLSPQETVCVLSLPSSLRVGFISMVAGLSLEVIDHFQQEFKLHVQFSTCASVNGISSAGCWPIVQRMLILSLLLHESGHLSERQHVASLVCSLRTLLFVPAFDGKDLVLNCIASTTPRTNDPFVLIALIWMQQCILLRHGYYLPSMRLGEAAQHLWPRLQHDLAILNCGDPLQNLEYVVYNKLVLTLIHGAVASIFAGNIMLARSLTDTLVSHQV
jgi:hypothetical protein